jgi:hypothetical protein
LDIRQKSYRVVPITIQRYMHVKCPHHYHVVGVAEKSCC